jgi:hypothetical protein
MTEPQRLGIGQMAGIYGHELTDDEMAGDFFGASVVAFGDREFTMAHNTYEDPAMVRLYGSESYYDGIVARNLHAAALRNGTANSLLTNYQRHVAIEYSRQLPSLEVASIPESKVRIDNQSSFTVSGQTFPAATPIHSVIDYGPGIAGRTHIGEQYSMWAAHETPYRYITASRLPFTNTFLAAEYERLSPGLSKQMQDETFYVGHEEGMAATSHNLLTSLSQRNLQLEIADLVLACAIETAPQKEVEVAIKNAFYLIKAGGTLVVQSVAEDRGGEVTAERMVDWSYQAGFDRNSTTAFETIGDDSPSHRLMGIEPRRIHTAILLKS